jgi:hypothetical protein
MSYPDAKMSIQKHGGGGGRRVVLSPRERSPRGDKMSILHKWGKIYAQFSNHEYKSKFNEWGI